MPRLSKDQTYQKLRRAVIDEAVAKGFAGTGVAGVVKRAKVSAGTVYVHFEDKNDMLQRVYMEVKAEFHEAVTGPKDMEDSKAMVQAMWNAMFDFVGKDPGSFLFLEYGSTAGILSEEQKAVTDRYAKEIAAMLQRGVDSGALAKLDTQLLSLLLVAPALTLARSAALNDQPPTDEIIQLAFERVWLSIRNS